MNRTCSYGGCYRPAVFRITHPAGIDNKYWTDDFCLGHLACTLEAFLHKGLSCDKVTVEFVPNIKGQPKPLFPGESPRWTAADELQQSQAYELAIQRRSINEVLQEYREKR